MNTQESRAPAKVALSRKLAFAAAAKKPGRYTDKDFAHLGLQVSPRGKAVWFARFRDTVGNEQRRTLGVAVLAGDGLLTFDYEQAKSWALERMRDANRASGQVGATDYSTLAGVWETFLCNRRTKKGLPLSDETKRDYVKWYRIALHPVKGWKLAEASVIQWIGFLTEVKSKYGEAKALYMSNIISSVYSFLMGLDQLDYNPMTKVRLARLFVPPKAKTSHVATIHLQAFYEGIDAALTRQDSKDAVLLLFMSGMRLTAGLGMRWDQLDLDNGYYHVEPGQAGWKGFTGVMPLSDYILDLLRNRHSHRKSDVYVFPKRHGQKGAPHLSRVSDALKAICEYVGMERVCAHDLRRTMATVAKLAFGAEIDKVAVLLSHKWAVDDKKMVVSKGAITKRYIQQELVTLRAIANTADACMQELIGIRPMSTVTSERLVQDGHTVTQLALLVLPENAEERALMAA